MHVWLAAEILVRRFDMTAQMRSCVPWPAWVIEDRTRNGDQVSITCGHDSFSLFEACNQTNGNHGDGNLLLDGTGQRNLIAWSNWNVLPKAQSATGNVDGIAATGF